jgi:hypothetical protein
VLNRSKPNETDIGNWVENRNTQCNFDTILQVISLRSQPDVVKSPTQKIVTEDDLQNFGFLYTIEEENANIWQFDFEVQHPSVFENGITEFGALYNDCNGVPMINCNNQLKNVPNFLNISDELSNIYFEVI